MDPPLISSSASAQRSSVTGTASLTPGFSLETAFDYDEHLIGLDELERRLSTSCSTGLSSTTVQQRQQQHGLNMLPTDSEAGHGTIHELVAVLRDGAWLHMRAENLLPGDVISLQPEQCVPADVRMIESDDMWVSQRAVNGKLESGSRSATASDASVFSDGGARVDYLEALNIALYGSTVTRGSGKAIVLRTGANTVLGGVSAAVMRNRSESPKHCDVPLPESIRQLGVSARKDLLPSAIRRVSALVVDHPDPVITRAVVACCFGVSPPVVVEVDDPILANETSSDDLERDIASQVAAYAQEGDQHAQQLAKALGACYYRIETSGGGDQSRVPTLPASSPIAAPVVLDPARDQSAIRRFGALFAAAGSSPRAKARSKATLLRGQLSSCEMLVHFDEERRAHVVLLVGPTREILSRCAHVRREASSALAPLETTELHALQDVVADMEARGQTVVSFAELSLDPNKYPVGIKFDLSSDNFPTSGLCYLGSLALAEKLHPEVVLMGAFARSAGVRLLVSASHREFPQFDTTHGRSSSSSSATSDDSDDDDDDDDYAEIDSEAGGVGGESRRRRVRAICQVPVELREAATGRAEVVDARVFPSSTLSVSNTLRQWQRVVQDRAIVVFDGCGPAQIDLLVETLQELGECVALAASGSANALSVGNADVGFAVPAHDVVDLCEAAADVVLDSATCPRSDAIRLIESVKKLSLLGADDMAATQLPPSANAQGNGSRGKDTMVNLMREALNVGRMLGINERELRQCFEHAFQDFTQQESMPRTLAQASTMRPASPLRAGPSTSKRATSKDLNAESTAPKPLPNDAIFNTQFTSAGRRFLSKVKKNRAMQVDRRSKGFHVGLEQRTVIIDPITKRHYRVLILDPDLQRREELADDLEQYFEILVAPSNERAFALLGMFKVDFMLVFVGAGNDKSIATSPALAFLREMKKKYFSTPAAALVAPLEPADSEMLKLLQRALHQGGLCGFFEVDSPRDLLIARLAKLMHSLVVAQEELERSYGKSRALGANNADEVAPTSAMKKRATITRLGQEAATRASRKPDSVTYDREGMLLELSLNQRKHCLQQRRAVTEAIAKGPRSVLGVDRELPPSSAGPESVSGAPSTAAALVSPDKRLSISRKIPPLPSQQEVSKLIYAKPHEIQGKIHRHLYERFRLSSASDALPQDPLLHHCVAIDPRSVLPPANRSNISTGTAGVDAVINAYYLYQEQRFDEAMAQCGRAARTQSGNLLAAKLALLLRGVLLDTRGDFAQAEKTFDKCLALDPDMHEALFNLSVSRLKQGKDRAALEAVTAALRLAPGNSRYLQNRALIFRRSGEFASAQSDYAKVLGSSSAIGRGASAGAVGQSALPSPTNAGSPSNRMNKCDVEDGVFDHLFGKPPADKLALVCAPELRTDEMVAAIAERLQSLLFFQHFSTNALTAVARVVEFDVVACGKAFAMAEAHPLSFYVLLGGRLSVRRKMGDFAMSTVTTHHLDVGMVFGCAGHAISAHSTLIADECAEIGIVWPGDYADTIHAESTDKNHEVFLFLQNQVKVFRAFSTSELGHLVGISERRRFRKGDVLLDQNQVPSHFIVLWKGSCAMYQDFSRPPLAEDSASDSEDDDGDDGDSSRKLQLDKSKPPLPFHRHLAKPNWPLGFQTRARSSKSRKYQHGRRHGLALGPPASSELAIDAAYACSAIPMPLVLPESHRPAGKRNAHIQTFVSPAIFGESAFLDQQHATSKCTVVAESLVEVLLFEHSRLQEMELSPEVVLEILANGSKYLDEAEVAKNAAKAESWSDYKSKRMLELSKRRWPEAKRHLRTLSNGCSIILSAVGGPAPAAWPATSLCCSRVAQADACTDR